MDTPDRNEPTFAEEIVFDANLQEFAQKVGFVCGLESGGKIPPGEAYTRIKELWRELKRSKKQLRIVSSKKKDDDHGGQ